MLTRGAPYRTSRPASLSSAKPRQHLLPHPTPPPLFVVRCCFTPTWGARGARCRPALSHPAHPRQSPDTRRTLPCRSVSEGTRLVGALRARVAAAPSRGTNAWRAFTNSLPALRTNHLARADRSGVLRQVRVAATNIMPGRRVTANDIVHPQSLRAPLPAPVALCLPAAP